MKADQGPRGEKVSLWQWWYSEPLTCPSFNSHLLAVKAAFVHFELVDNTLFMPWTEQLSGTSPSSSVWLSFQFLNNLATNFLFPIPLPHLQLLSTVPWIFCSQRRSDPQISFLYGTCAVLQTWPFQGTHLNSWKSITLYQLQVSNFTSARVCNQNRLLLSIVTG